MASKRDEMYEMKRQRYLQSKGGGGGGGEDDFGAGRQASRGGGGGGGGGGMGGASSGDDDPYGARGEKHERSWPPPNAIPSRYHC